MVEEHKKHLPHVPELSFDDCFLCELQTVSSSSIELITCTLNTSGFLSEHFPKHKSISSRPPISLAFGWKAHNALIGVVAIFDHADFPNWCFHEHCLLALRCRYLHFCILDSSDQRNVSCKAACTSNTKEVIHCHSFAGLAHQLNFPLLEFNWL